MSKPYINTQVTDKYIIREFNENIDPIELKWHRDLENRTVEVLEGEGWQFQRDNELPVELKEGVRIFIPKLEWHRVIKGKGTLKLKINKINI
jgi:quercetin dioxygenase-like cupin family protein